jgi:hypothetical protein
LASNPRVLTVQCVARVILMFGKQQLFPIIRILNELCSNLVAGLR